MIDSDPANTLPAPAPRAASSVSPRSPDGVANVPNKLQRVIRSLRTVEAIVNDCRGEWIEFTETDFEGLGKDEKRAVSALMKLFQ